jgi:hypothetical protein
VREIERKRVRRGRRTGEKEKARGKRERHKDNKDKRFRKRCSM